MNKKLVQNKLIKFIRYFFKPWFKLIFGMRVEGRENLPKDRGYVICCNHVTWLDPVFCLMQTRVNIYFMGKSELFQNKLLGWFLKHCNVFAVERGKGDMQSSNYAIDLVKSGNFLGIFTEGTRSKDGKPGKAKSGAAYIANATNADVVPIAIVFKRKLRIFKRVKLYIGKPIPHEEIHFEATDRKGLRNASTKIMGGIVDLWEKGQNEFKH